MRYSRWIPVLVSAVLLVGCGRESVDSSTGPDAAESALRQYLVAADAGDCDAVKESVLDPDGVECSDVREQKGRWTGDGADVRQVPMEVEVVEDSAMVTVEWPDEQAELWDLQVVDGAWRVVNADAGDGV